MVMTVMTVLAYHMVMQNQMNAAYVMGMELAVIVALLFV